MRPDISIVVRAEQTPERGLNPQHREIGPGHEHPAAVHRLSAIGKVDPEADVRGDAGEHRLLPLQIPEHRVAEHVLAVARLPAGLRPRLRPRGGQVHQLAWTRHRQRPQQRLVEQGENGRICPDSQRQGRDGDDADEGRLEEAAEGKLQVHTVLQGQKGSRNDRGNRDGKRFIRIRTEE